jgi:Caspase domain/WD domain, G-beta repeat/WD40-like Beta Propeller Repeat
MAEFDRHALVVSSSRYADPTLQPLTAPTDDADALAAVLRDPSVGGFRVREIIDQPSWVVAEEVERFFVERNLNDVSLFYFSGHGIKDEDGALYFAAMNTKRQFLRSTAVPSDHMVAAMRRCRSRQQVLLLDCCYAGAFSRAMLTKGDERVGVQERFATEGAGRVVITASDAMQYAFEGDQLRGEAPLSVFTRTLVEGIRTGEADQNHDGRVSLDELYDYVYERIRVMNASQTPTTSNLDKRGEIVIALNPHVTTPEPEAELVETQRPVEVAGRVEPVAQAMSPPEDEAEVAAPQSAVPAGKGGAAEVEAGFAVSEIVSVEHVGESLWGGAALSPDGRYLATTATGPGESVRIWEVPSGRQVLSLKAEDTPFALAFSPDGHYFATGARLWELPEGREVLSRKVSGSPAFSPDGRLLARAGSPPRVWELPGGREVIELKAGAGHHLRVAFSPDGHLLAASTLSTARVWELPSGREVGAVKHGNFWNNITDVAFSPDGGYLATVSKTVRMWELPRCLEAGSVGHEGISKLAFSPDGRYLVTTAHRDVAARVWELLSGREIDRVSHPGVYDVAFTPDGRYLVTAGKNTARVWRVSSDASA